MRNSRHFVHPFFLRDSGKAEHPADYMLDDKWLKNSTAYEHTFGSSLDHPNLILLLNFPSIFLVVTDRETTRAASIGEFTFRSYWGSCWHPTSLALGPGDDGSHSRISNTIPLTSKVQPGRRPHADQTSRFTSESLFFTRFSGCYVRLTQGQGRSSVLRQAWGGRGGWRRQLRITILGGKYKQAKDYDLRAHLLGPDATLLPASYHDLTE